MQTHAHLHVRTHTSTCVCREGKKQFAKNSNFFYGCVNGYPYKFGKRCESALISAQGDRERERGIKRESVCDKESVGDFKKNSSLNENINFSNAGGFSRKTIILYKIFSKVHNSITKPKTTSRWEHPAMFVQFLLRATTFTADYEIYWVKILEPTTIAGPAVHLYTGAMQECHSERVNHRSKVSSLYNARVLGFAGKKRKQKKKRTQ